MRASLMFVWSFAMLSARNCMRDTEAAAKAPRHSVSISSLIWNSKAGESGCLTDMMKPVRKESRIEMVSSDLLALSSRSAAVLSVKETF